MDKAHFFRGSVLHIRRWFHFFENDSLRLDPHNPGKNRLAFIIVSGPKDRIDQIKKIYLVPGLFKNQDKYSVKYCMQAVRYLQDI